MYCPSCGAQNGDPSAFCTNCGNDLRSITGAVRGAAPVAVPPDAPVRPAGSPRVPVPSEDPFDPLVFPQDSYAGFWKRFLAWLIDSTVLVVFIVIGSIVDGSFDADSWDLQWLDLIAFLLAWLYHAGMHSSKYQATLGKMAMGIIVVGYDGQRISFWRATGRYFAKLLSQLTLLIGYLMAIWTPRRQGLHDMIASTLVIERPRPPGY